MLCSTIFLGGCAGRTAHPVVLRMPGDEERSCDSLITEMRQIQVEIARLQPKSSKLGRNAACVGTGIFLVVPLFFMDLKNADKTELNAYISRYNYLAQVGQGKGCQLPATQLPTK
jgi:hypothetical protein